jgi:cytochrome c553
MRWQPTSMTLGLAGALVATVAGAALSNELLDALGRKPDLERGRSLYQACMGCHQLDGAGAADRGIPIIAGQHYEVLIAQLIDFRRTERVELRMNAMAASHRLKSTQDLADVAAHISSMPAQRTREVGTGKFTALGAQVYSRACASCHGADAEGNDELRHPRLAGQHYSYLVNQIDAMIRGLRFNLSWDHSKLLESLTEEEIAGVADYVARLEPHGNSPAK